MAAVTLGAGGAGGYANARILQNDDGVLRGNAGDGNVQNVGCLVRTVDEDTIEFT